MEKSIARKIAEYSVGLNYNDLPGEVIHEVKRYLYDSIGCAIAGMDTKDVGILTSLLTETGGIPEAHVIGRNARLPMANAALINSLMVRALDFNDIYWKDDPSHPSDLIPAALACAEASGSDMRTAITAIVLGYEFEQRLCEFAKPGFRERKWHHATITQLVSPIVAGKALGLTVDQMVNAIGISGCHHATIGCPTAGKLTMMKNTVDPFAVQSGVFAACMAKRGYTGTEAIFEGKEGIMDVFGGNWDIDAIFRDQGAPYKITQCSMKAFPTEALTHTHITAALKIVNEHNIQPELIQLVTVTTIARAVDILFDPHKYHPDSRETADHSLPYCVAAAIVDRKITTETFSELKLADQKIRNVMAKIKGEASVPFEQMFPAKQPSKVSIITTDGAEYSAYLEYPKGDPREPMTQNDLDNKFNALTGKRLSPDQQRAVKELVYDAESYTPAEFMQHIADNVKE